VEEDNQLGFEFPGLGRRKIEANFAGGQVSSDGGVMLLRQVDRWLGFSKRLDRILPERRNPLLIQHSQESLLRQRIYGLALGYEDLNDHDSLRHDVLWQTATDRTEELGSCATLCRLENRAGRKEAWLIHQVLFEQFVGSFAASPRELVLDFDCTDDRVHGMQVGRAFHGYYYDYCFLPLYVFCGEQLLVSYLRPSNIDPAKHAWAILAKLVGALRERWPEVKIILRADSGFCRWKMLRWCESHQVDYIVGIAKNERLKALSAKLGQRAERKHRKSGEKVRLFQRFKYRAGSWDKKRCIIAKAEHTAEGANPRFVVTNLVGRAQTLYDQIYCARGEMENRIKEQQLGLFSDRTSCHYWWPNQFRLLLSSCAYVLIEALRRLGLKSTELARAQVGTIRLKLLKIGAVITRNTRRVRIWFSSAFPLKDLFKFCLAYFYG
jgi:Transposase DDE domain group 1